MWPLSWYQFCVSLPLEVRTVGLVLFLQVLTLLSVLHCLPPAGHVEPVFSDSVFSAAVRRNNRELHNTEKKVLFATCAAPVPRYSRHDLLSLETAAAPPPFLFPPADCTSITSRHCEKRAQKATPIEKRREEWTEEDQSDRRFSWSTFIRFFQLSNPMSTHHFRTTFLNTPLPYHLPLHPETVTTSQPPRSALRCVPLTDSCFTFPLVLPQPKTHSLSASSMQDPSALPGGGPTYPPSFRKTTSTSCCWRRPGCALSVTRPRSPSWLRLGTRSSPSPAQEGGPTQKAGASPSS